MKTSEYCSQLICSLKECKNMEMHMKCNARLMYNQTWPELRAVVL